LCYFMVKWFLPQRDTKVSPRLTKENKVFTHSN
jgi:hypothetical protein